MTLCIVPLVGSFDWLKTDETDRTNEAESIY